MCYMCYLSIIEVYCCTLITGASYTGASYTGASYTGVSYTGATLGERETEIENIGLGG
jgi:hypothetical protein